LSAARIRERFGKTQTRQSITGHRLRTIGIMSDRLVSKVMASARDLVRR
jgi:hypothetical protein